VQPIRVGLSALYGGLFFVVAAFNFYVYGVTHDGMQLGLGIMMGVIGLMYTFGTFLAERAFEPFFTTKVKGTGLGLSQVHGFANQSGGAVTVASEPDRGTVVTVYLPRAQTEVPAEPGTSASTGRQNVQGTVLVVEDSRDVADVTSALLEQLGYRVVRAENAAEALRHLQQGIEFSLLFSDIVMPGTMDGLGLAQVCREQYPDLPILLTSGFSDAAQAADGHFDILRKPFELSVLERAIDQVIGDARSRPRASASS